MQCDPGRDGAAGDQPALTAAERKALENVRLVVELPRVLSAQLEGASGGAPKGLEDLARLLVGCVSVSNDAMGSLVAEVLASDFETLQIPCDEEARAEALADLEYTNLIAGGLYLSATRLLGETGAA